MLETQDKVVRILLQAMREVGMTASGRVVFGPVGYDFAGVMEQHDFNMAPDFALRWKLELRYPREGVESMLYNIEIHTFDFDSESQIKDYVVRCLQEQQSE